MNRNFIVDEEISLSNENDILKTKVYAETLSKVISNTPKDRVFTIGLFGGWGTGKSSIIKTVRKKLETVKVKFITYDAWKYANDSFRRMFLLKIQEELRYEQSEEMQRFYQSETAETEPKTYISKQGLLVFILFLLIVLVVVNCLPINDVFKIAISSMASLTGLLVTIFNGVFQKLKIQISKPHLFAPEQFENCFKEMTSAAFKEDNKLVKALKYIRLIPKSITGIEKLIIVIDNIDRCHSEMAYQLLTDIKTFLSDEKINVVFIIPVDDEALKQNLFDRRDNQDCDKEKEEFLRKFFNVTIRTKPHQSTELNTFAKALNNKYSLGFNENTIALCSKEFATNPRRIIQLFNNLASELSLYPEDFAKKNESMICIVLILREEYADFYTKIVNDANELKNYKQEKIVNENHLPDFMRIANPIIRQTDMSDLLHILTNSDAVFDGIPADIKKRIESYAIKETIEYIKSYPESKDIVLDLIKKNAKEDTKSQSDAQIVNSLEFISLLSNAIVLPDSFLVEFNSLFDNKYSSLLIKINKSKVGELCQFALLLDEHTLPELKQKILLYVTNINSNEDISEFNEQFIKAVLTKFNSKTDSNYLNNFIATLFKKTGVYKDIDYSQEQKEILFSKDLIQFFIEKITIGENNETQELLWLLRNTVNIENECYSSLCEKLNTLIGNTANKNKDQMILILKYVIGFLILIPDHSNIAQLKTLNATLWQRSVTIRQVNNRQVNNRQIYLLDECNGDLDNIHIIIDTVLKIYRIYNETITDSQVSKIVSSDKQYVYYKLLELKELNFDLSPFWDIIINDNGYETNTEQLIPLIEFCILQKDKNGELAIDSGKIKNKVTSLCNNISNPKVAELIEHLIKDEKMKPYFIDIIINKDTGYINALPQFLLEFAVNSFSQENSSHFVNNMGFLSVVATSGSPKQKTEIVKMMTEKINKKINLDETFDILKKIELKKTYNKNMLLSSLQSYKDSNPDDSRVDPLISKFEM